MGHWGTCRRHRGGGANEHLPTAANPQLARSRAWVTLLWSLSFGTFGRDGLYPRTKLLVFEHLLYSHCFALRLIPPLGEHGRLR